MKEKDEFEMLEYRLLNTRAKRTAFPESETKPVLKTAKEEKPEIHVHVAMPEVKDAPKTADAPRRWKFTHRYDVHNKLTETIAEAQ